MEVILLEEMDRLGHLGERVKVKAGYARNYLIPQGKATEATSKNLAAFEDRRADLERVQVESKAAAEVRLAKFDGVTLVIAMKTGSEGRLFGSVGSADIVAAAEKLGVELKKGEVRIADPIRQIGEHTVGLHLFNGVNGEVKLEVVSAE
jgi:large subunit ribosomal protein L9